jgi:hypothetical protein
MQSNSIISNLKDSTSSSIDSDHTLIKRRSIKNRFRMTLSDLKILTLKSIPKFEGNLTQLHQFLVCIESLLSDLSNDDKVYIVPLLNFIRQTLVSPKVFERTKYIKFEDFDSFKKNFCNKLYESEPPSVLKEDFRTSKEEVSFYFLTEKSYRPQLYSTQSLV